MEQNIWQIISDFFCSLDWKSILGYGVFSTLSVGGVVLFVGKKILSKVGEEAAKTAFIEQQTQIAESVKSEFTAAKEHLKAELSRQNTAYGVNYSFSYTERAKVLLDMYRKMVAFISCAEEYSNLFVPGATKADQDKTLETRVINLNKAHLEFNDCYANNRILLDKELAHKIFDFYATVNHLCKAYYTEYKRQSLPALREEERIKIQNTIQDISKKIHERCNQIDEFADIFRDLIFPTSKED